MKDMEERFNTKLENLKNELKNELKKELKNELKKELEGFRREMNTRLEALEDKKL